MQTPWPYTGRECSSQRIMRVKTTADTTPIQTRLTTTMYSAPRHNRMQHTTKVQAIKAMASPSCKWCRTGSKSAVARVFVYEANLLLIRTTWRRKRAIYKEITYVCNFYKLTTTWSRTHANIIVYPSRLPRILRARASKASQVTSVAASFKAMNLPRTNYKYRLFLTEQLIRQVWSREPRTTTMMSQNSRIVWVASSNNLAAVGRTTCSSQTSTRDKLLSHSFKYPRQII